VVDSGADNLRCDTAIQRKCGVRMALWENFLSKIVQLTVALSELEIKWLKNYLEDMKWS